MTMIATNRTGITNNNEIRIERVASLKVECTDLFVATYPMEGASIIGV